MDLSGERNRIIMKRILVGFDGSNGSENALDKALMLIEENGEIILLAVVPSGPDQIFLEKDMYKKMKEKANLIIKEKINNIRSNKFNTTGLVEEGDPSAKIIDISKKLNVDLIVLGSIGRSKIGWYTLGSVANRVVQYAHTPVMIVR